MSFAANTIYCKRRYLTVNLQTGKVVLTKEQAILCFEIQHMAYWKLHSAISPFVSIVSHLTTVERFAVSLDDTVIVFIKNN